MTFASQIDASQNVPTPRRGFVVYGQFSHKSQSARSSARPERSGQRTGQCRWDGENHVGNGRGAGDASWNNFVAYMALLKSLCLPKLSISRAFCARSPLLRCRLLRVSTVRRLAEYNFMFGPESVTVTSRELSVTGSFGSGAAYVSISGAGVALGRIQDAYDKAQSSGASGKYETHTQTLTDQRVPVKFVLRVAESLRDKPKPPKSRQVLSSEKPA